MNSLKQPIRYGDISFHYVKDIVSPDFFQNSPHSHDHCEIFIHEKGQFNIFVENTIYNHNSKEIRVYAPNELHFGKCESNQEMEWYQISISKSFFDQHSALGEIIFNRGRGTHNVFTSKKHAEISSLAAEIIEKKKQNSPLLENYFLGNIIRILCILNEKSNNTDIGTNQNKSLQEIIKLIDDNYLNIYTSQDLYKLTHFSVSYVHRLFKDYLNTTPHQFITIKKLNKACELLTSGATVSTACFHSGFNNYSNFITLFRKTYNQTPNAYKREHASAV